MKYVDFSELVTILMMYTNSVMSSKVNVSFAIIKFMIYILNLFHLSHLVIYNMILNNTRLMCCTISQYQLVTQWK